MRPESRKPNPLIITAGIFFLVLTGGISTCKADDGNMPPADNMPNPIMVASLNIPDYVIFPTDRKIIPVSPDLPAGEKNNRKMGPGRIHAAGHFLQSHLGIITRPFSSAAKLATMLVSAGHDSIRNLTLKESDPSVIPRLNPGKGMDLARWENDLDEITGTKPSSGRIRLLIDGEEFFSRLNRSVMEADESIHIRIYIYDNDDYALKMADLLKSRSRDVDVRVLTDGLGTIMANGVHPDSLPEDFHAPVSIKRYLKKDSKIRVRYQKNPWLTLDHTKTIIVDRKTAFIGGMNIGREYRYEWHDLMMEVDGPVVNTLQNEFNGAWAYAGLLGDFAKMFARKSKGSKAPKYNNYPIRTLFTRSGDSQIYNAQLEAIRRSQKYIYIQNPYLSDDAILNELIKARHRGVDVRVIIPREGNWNTMNRSNKLAANTMMKNGIRVYLFPVMSHVKAAIYDGWACVGSANFDKASFRTNQEINLATSNPEAVQELMDRLFTPDFERSDLMMKSNPVRFADYVSEIIADQL